MICDSQNVETEDRNSENETKTTRLTGGGGTWERGYFTEATAKTGQQGAVD